MVDLPNCTVSLLYSPLETMLMPNTVTSRLPASKDYHGRHGSFLASLAALSLLIISSKTAASHSRSALAIHHGIAIATEPSFLAGHHNAFSQGTLATVFDLFGSMPVRVKHRASLFSNSSDLTKEFRKLACDVTGLLLAWPSTVSVCMRESKGGGELRMRCPDGMDLAQKASRFFMQIGLADSSESSSWVPLSASIGSVSVEGCISTIPTATRKAQFISLGIHPLADVLGGNILFEEVNEIFASSSFGTIEDGETTATSTTGTKTKPRKGLEKWPMYYLRFHSDDAASILADGPIAPHSPTLTTITSLLRAVCYAFLKKHTMRPRKLPYRSKTLLKEATAGSSPLTERLSDIDMQNMASELSSPFDAWRRIKVGHRAGLSTASHNSAEHVQPLVGPGGKLLHKPFMEQSCNLISTKHSHGEQNIEQTWSPASYTPTSSQTLDACPKGSAREWLTNLRQSWTNPVFDTVEPAIHRLVNGTDALAMVNKPPGINDLSISGRISKTALQKAMVIAQVDNKFILIRLPLEPSTDVHSLSPPQPTNALFVVDQHAADERCRLEDLMGSYFETTGDTTTAMVEDLDQPIEFQVSSRELQMFHRHQGYMKRWGIMYRSAKAATPGSETVSVSALPPSILERCRGEPRVLIDALRSEIWRLEESSCLDHETAAPNSNFHGCPRGILEMLHSRACRSKLPALYTISCANKFFLSRRNYVQR